MPNPLFLELNAATLRPIWNWFAVAATLLAPIAYLVAIFVWHSPERMTGENRFYDDLDMTALAQRGWNAHLGRIPGYLPEAPIVSREEFADALDLHLPLKRRSFLEYPLSTTLLFRIPFELHATPADVPTALLDGHYANVVMHEPRDDRQRQLWAEILFAIASYRVLMTIALLAFAAILLVGYEPGQGVIYPGLVLALPPVLYFAVNRFDMLPVLLSAASLACLGRKRYLGSAVCLALAVLLKMYPLLLAPLVLRYLWSRPSDRPALNRWLFGFVAAMALFLLPPLLMWGMEAVLAPYSYQLGRAPFLWTIYGYLVPERLEWNDLFGSGFRAGTLILVEAALLWRPIGDMRSLLRRAAIIVVVFINLSIFYSPQWILWLLPFLIPLARDEPSFGWLMAILACVTYVNWPTMPRQPWMDFVVYLRFATYAVLLFVLIREEMRARPTSRTA
jgi:hypothetical protein